MIVVDTSVWIGHFRRMDLPQVHALRQLPADEILLGDVVLLEILQGESSEPRADRLARELGTSAPNVSQHLRVLKDLGLVYGERRRYRIHYFLARDRFRYYAELVPALLGD